MCGGWNDTRHIHYQNTLYKDKTNLAKCRTNSHVSLTVYVKPTLESDIILATTLYDRETQT
jgi:hypothetical protein